MPDYTYPRIFPDLRENPRDLETWLSANVVNQEEGSGLWASSTHQHADAIRINTTTSAGGNIPSTEGVLAYVEITEGVPVSSDVLVDVTMQVEAANVDAGYYWGVRLAVQDVAQGSLMYRQGEAHGHSVPASGTADNAGSHTHTGPLHLHGINDGGQHSHGAATGAPSPTSTAAESSHVHSGPSHTHDPQGDVDLYYGTPVHDHGTSLMTNTYGGTGNTGATSHSHSLNSHTHSIDPSILHSHGGATGYEGSGSTGQHTGHSHNLSISASASSGGGGMTKDNITIRWVGIVDTGVGGVIKLSALGICPSVATWTKIAFTGLVWVIPTVLASQIGGLDDIADVATPTPADGQVLTWSAPANAWIAQSVETAAGGWAGRMLLMGG